MSEGLSGDEIEQAGRILLPVFKEAVRSEVETVRAGLVGLVNEHKAESEARFEAVEKRVSELDAVKKKALIGYGGIVLVASLAFNAGKEKLVGWLTGGK